MKRLLDPKLDIVFKLLFADDRNRELLCSLLTAVLAPERPITRVEVLNPETPKETVLQKGAVLDVRARVLDGPQTHVEMQAAPHPGLRQRALYYWARLYAGQLGRGRHYVRLVPTVSVFILGFVDLPTVGYHTVFRLLDTLEGVELTDHLTLHVLELPKLPRRRASGDNPVLKWMRFFAAQTEQELEQLAMIDPDLRKAKTALEHLSADPAARELAQDRELAVWNHELGLQLARDEGRTEGEARGRAEGERDLLRRLLVRKFGELPAHARARLETASEEELGRWAERLLAAASVEDVLE